MSRPKQADVAAGDRHGLGHRPLPGGILFVAAPTIGVDLHADLATLAWLTAAFFLVAASLPHPVRAHRRSKASRRSSPWAWWYSAISGAVCVLAPTFEVLILGRALTGIGAAMGSGHPSPCSAWPSPTRTGAKPSGSTSPSCSQASPAVCFWAACSPIT